MKTLFRKLRALWRTGLVALKSFCAGDIVRYYCTQVLFIELKWRVNKLSMTRLKEFRSYVNKFFKEG